VQRYAATKSKCTDGLPRIAANQKLGAITRSASLQAVSTLLMACSDARHENVTLLLQWARLCLA